MKIFIKFLKSLIKLFSNLLFAMQIFLMVLVFLTASYWLFDLMGTGYFSFAEPITNVVKDLVRLFYNQDVLIGGLYIDGSLLLFDFIAILVVLFITKLKYYLNCMIDYTDTMAEKYKQIEEDNFNKALKKETDAKIRKMNSFALLIELEIKYKFANKHYNSSTNDRDLKTKELSAYKLLLSTLKNINTCKFAKKGEKLLVICENFSKIDNVVYFIEQAILKIKKNLQNENLLLISYIAAEVYENEKEFKDHVCHSLEQLIHLKNKDTVTCFGNFNLRYALKPEPMYYTMLLRGAYMIDGGADIYVLLKRIDT